MNKTYAAREFAKRAVGGLEVYLGFQLNLSYPWPELCFGSWKECGAPPEIRLAADLAGFVLAVDGMFRAVMGGGPLNLAYRYLHYKTTGRQNQWFPMLTLPEHIGEEHAK